LGETDFATRNDVEVIKEAARARTSVSAGVGGAMMASDFEHEHALQALQLPSGVCAGGK